MCGGYNPLGFDGCVMHFLLCVFVGLGLHLCASLALHTVFIIICTYAWRAFKLQVWLRQRIDGCFSFYLADR